MERIAKFEKVSKAQFEKDGGAGYDFVILPQRATSGSAGYDFYSSEEIVVPPDSEKLIPTGIRAKISDGWVLCIFPRSGLGFKYGIALKNTVGVIDSDYYSSKNEGHIMIKIKNPSDEEVIIPQNKAFAQGVFLPFGITEDDDVSKDRDGGFGSTDNR
jgi:dUTP pyrophosphatase